MVVEDLQCAKPKITKTIVRKVRREHQVSCCNESHLSVLKASKQGSHTLSRQPFLDAKVHTSNSPVNTNKTRWSTDLSLQGCQTNPDFTTT